MTARSLIAAVAAVLMPAMAQAQTQPAAVPPPAQPVTCAAMDKAVPAPWTEWTAPGALLGGSTLGAAGKLVVGHAYTAALAASPGVTYIVPLNKPAAPETFAGLFTLNVDKAGTYSIALSEGAWIDVAPVAGPVLSSVSHAHGPECTTIRKVVDFALQPGAYVVQVSGATRSPVVIAVEPKA